MSGSNSYIWIISGRVLKINGITPFINSDGLNIKLYENGNFANQCGNTGINDNDGNFSITLSKQQFGNAAPSLVVKVYDDQGRVLYTSNAFTLSQTEDSYSLGNVAVIDMPVPHVWTIRGLAFNNSVPTPFTQGIIRAFDGQTGAEQYAESGFYFNHGQEGSFGLTINRSSFQKGDVAKVAPSVILRIFSYQNQLLWQHGPFTVPHCDYYINPLVTIPMGNSTVDDMPSVDNNWTVSGTLRDGNNLPSAQPFTVKAFDVLYNNASTLLGVQANAVGTYQINYHKSAFQQGDTGRIAPNLRVEVFSGDNLVAESGIFVQAANPQMINIDVVNITSDVPQDWSVSGTISRDGQIPSSPLTVRAFDRFDDQNDDGLGIEVQTNANGAYAINYTKFDFQGRDPGRIAPNLIVKVFSENVLVAISETFYPAATHEVVNIGFTSGTTAVPNNWSVRGTILKNGMISSDTLTVKAFDNETDTQLGAAVQTNPNDGTYTINYTKSDFQNGDSARIAPNLAVKVFSGNTFVAMSEIFDPVSTHEVVNIGFTSGTIAVPNNWSVRGTVLEADKVPLNSLVVKAFDRFPNQNDVLLGEISTNQNDGTYTINYTKSAFQKHDTGRVVPNLVVKVFSEDKLVAAHGPFYPAGNNALVNINFVPLNWKVSGKVTKHDNMPMNSGRVDVWDVYLGKEFPIGSSSLDLNGNYSVAFTKEKFELEENYGNEKRRHPDLLIRIYNSDGIMVGYNYLPYEGSEKYQRNVYLYSVANKFHVSGKISNTQGYPVSNSVVIVKNVLLYNGVFQEVELGRGLSEPTSGVYNISFYPDLVIAGGVKYFNSIESFNLARFVVEVYTISGEKTGYPLGPLEFAGKSNLIKATDQKLSADFVIDAQSDADISVYTDIRRQLSDKGFTTKSSIVDLASDESKLEYAAELTGVPKEDILIIALAEFILSELKYQLAGHSGLPNKVNQQIMYALVRTGNAESYQDLLKITADRLQTVIISAVTQSIIPSTVQSDLPCIISEWQQIYSILLQKDTGKSNAGRIFSYAMPSDSKNKHHVSGANRQIVIDAYAEYSHDLEKYWAELEEKLPIAVVPALIDRLKFFFDIHKFADEFGPLSNAMMEYADDEEYASLEDFVELEKENWFNGIIGKIKDFTEIIDPTEVTEWPESVPGESDDEKRNNYATILFKRIVALFSMKRFRSDLENAKDEAAETGFDLEWWEPVYDFLNDREAFDFADAITNDDFDYTPDSAKEEIEELQEQYSRLLVVQRLYRLTPKLEVIDALRKKGLESAMSIAHENCDEFAKECGELVGGIDDAQALHAAAVHTASQALFLMGTFNRQSDLPEASIPAVTEKQPELDTNQWHGSQIQPMSATSAVFAVSSNSSNAKIIKPIVPNIATLFGSQNQCLCEECQSVFSPSAYMVDLVEFLNDEVRNELFSRRPDLSETDLSCRNTHGAVAYIDLVNEILENEVCKRTFNIMNSAVNEFLEKLRSKIGRDKKSSFAIGDALPAGTKMPTVVINEFGSKGFYIDKEFYVQGIKDADETKEINSKWYIIGDGWRYLIELSANKTFQVTPYPQTGKDAQLRRVKPEHTHWGAYETLKNSLDPTNLPFNLHFAEVNEFIKLKNSNRHKLYHAMHTQSEIFDADESGMQAFFEMTDSQKTLITTYTSAKTLELWGFSSEVELLASLGNAEAVMKKLSITLDQFFDLMRTYFVASPNLASYVYLDWGEGFAYENGELDKLEIKNGSLAGYSRIVRLQRLSNHLGLDVVTVDRLISMQRLTATTEGQIAINNTVLINLFKYLKVAEEFSVSPIRAASWLCCWIENFNLGRGKPSQFEELFLSNVDTPDRAAVWKDMLNDIVDIEDDNRKFQASIGTNDKDIATLLKGLKVSYNDLSLIAQEELEINIGSTDPETNLNSVNLTITNLTKMFRVADFSKVLGISVSDFYRLKSILNVPTGEFPLEFLIESRSFLAKLKRSKISIEAFQYLLSGGNEDKISWLPSEGDELKTIAKIHNEVVKTKYRYDEDNEDSQELIAKAIEETILNELAAVYKISVDICRTVLENALTGDSGKTLLQHWVDICAIELDEASQPEDIFGEINGYLDKIANVAFLIRTLKITVDEIDFFAAYPDAVHGLDFNALGTSGDQPDKYKSLVALLDVYILDLELPFKNKNFTIFDLLREAQNTQQTEDSFKQVIAREIDWQHEDILAVTDVGFFNFTLAQFKQIDSWSVLNRTLGLLKRLGLTASFAKTLISQPNNSPEQSEAFISALRAGYNTQSQWIEAAEPIRNNLRRRQRDALCAYLLRHGFVNRAAIYAHCLIDVNMDTDVMTTRIVQANSSIQMLLQRALLNFEYIELNDKIKQQWPWMKNYRLWEANRKIFLYPENWLEPEFRDDKTPLFKELESAMLQKELSPSNVREAFRAYASGLSEIANLEVIGAYGENDQNDDVLHVVGRTFRYPHSYYYRRNHGGTGGSGYWTPWEKVDLDITADMVLPVPFRNKIYIFWPLIELKDKAVPNEESKENESQFKDSFKYYEIKLAWSEFSEGKWSAKRISVNSYIHVAEHIDNELVKPTDLFHFRADVNGDNVEIQVFAYNKDIEEIEVRVPVVKSQTKVIKSKGVRRLFGKKRKVTEQVIEEEIKIIRNEVEAISRIAAFSFGSDNSARLVPVEDDRNYIESPMIPPGTDMRHNRAEESEANQDSSDYGALEYPAGNVLLKRTPELFTCFPVNLSFLGEDLKPFFLRLNEKTLFIKPIVSSEPHSIDNEQAFDSASPKYHQMVNFYHPLADDLVKKANSNSVDGLLNRSTQANAKGEQYPLGYMAVGDGHAGHLADLDFEYKYRPEKTILGGFPMPVNDFSLNSTFGIYNWELFYHLPMYIATRLSHDKQYEEAMRWFHYIFDPAGDFTTWEKTQKWIWDLPDGARFWNFLPFFANRGALDSIYKAVEKSQIPDEDTGLGSLMDSWKSDPFKPHLIARVRTAAYQKSVVMKYLDNLIEWGDSLFRLDHMEAINEATQLYTQASEILGDRPVLVPKLHEMPGLTYTQLKAEGLDQFGNTVIQLENYIPPPPPVKVKFWRAKQAPSRYYYYHYNYNYSYNSSVEAVPHKSVQLLRMAPALHYFCIPRNDRLIGYWDLVDDRLFKIRHSMNIDGVKRVIPLFAPPIDPGMLARASAMGISIGALLRDMQSTPTAYRFATVFQKAVELCNELKSFGSELLSALEKKDAESLALLRNNHEIELLKLVKEVKKKTVQESTQSLEALLKTKAITEERYNYYQEIERISEGESQQINASNAATNFHLIGQAMILAAGPASFIPDTILGALVGISGGLITEAHVGGGEKSSSSLERLGNSFNALAGINDRTASNAGIKASYDRRWKEWKLQEKLAQKELTQLDKQILCAEIRLSIAEKDLSNHDRQIEQAQELKEVMESKFSNEKLYQWMADELNKSYNVMYDIAYGAAKKAEKAFQFELGSKQVFINPEIWSSTNKGLLAGNRLSVLLRQMDAAYIENNRREFEITKAVSLSMLNPEELLKLRETGSCKISLPEMIYDLDCPGQYFRRIKSVRITIPCVAGPYTNISAKLRLESSKIRTNDFLANDDYLEDPDGSDERFQYRPIPEGASISTSGAMMDSGMFDFNFRDERYLPFEGAGAISEWELELPADYRQFDYGTITDVILHVSYTAREATLHGFKDKVIEYLDDYLESLECIPNMISLSQSFPDQFESIVNGVKEKISLNEEEHFPHLIVDYWRRHNGEGISGIKNLKVFVLLKNSGTPEIEIDGKSVNKTDKSNLYEWEFTNFKSCPWEIKLTKDAGDEVEDIFLYFGYSVEGEEHEL